LYYSTKLTMEKITHLSDLSKKPPVATKAFLLLLEKLKLLELDLAIHSLAIHSTEYDNKLGEYQVKVSFKVEVTLEGNVSKQTRLLVVYIDAFSNGYMEPFMSDNLHERGVIDVSDSTRFLTSVPVRNIKKNARFIGDLDKIQSEELIDNVIVEIKLKVIHFNKDWDYILCP